MLARGNDTCLTLVLCKAECQKAALPPSSPGLRGALWAVFLPARSAYWSKNTAFFWLFAILFSLPGIPQILCQPKKYLLMLLRLNSSTFSVKAFPR